MRDWGWSFSFLIILSLRDPHGSLSPLLELATSHLLQKAFPGPQMNERTVQKEVSVWSRPHGAFASVTVKERGGSWEVVFCPGTAWSEKSQVYTYSCSRNSACVHQCRIETWRRNLEGSRKEYGEGNSTGCRKSWRSSSQTDARLASRWLWNAAGDLLETHSPGSVDRFTHPPLLIA